MQITADPGPRDLIDRVRAVEKEVLEDLSDFWEKRGAPAVATEFARVFATEGYGRWPALSPLYAAQKAIEAPFKTILRRSDRYFRAVTQKGVAGHFSVFEKDAMEWGVDLDDFQDAYPLRHETGRGVPARPVFALVEESANLEKDILDVLTEHFTDEIRKRFA